MSAITGVCGKRFDAMADFIRHLPTCVLCAAASMNPKSRR